MEGVTGSTVTLNASLPSQASAGVIVFDYTIPLYRPLRVMGGRRYNYLSTIDLPMQMWSRLDYQAQPNRYARGIPTAFFYDPQTGEGSYSQPQGQWNSWPTPKNNTNAARFTAQRPIQDIGSLANIPDFPVEWNAALKWNLALEIAPENGVPTEQISIIEQQAKDGTTWPRSGTAKRIYRLRSGLHPRPEERLMSFDEKEPPEEPARQTYPERYRVGSWVCWRLYYNPPTTPKGKAPYADLPWPS